MFVDQMCSEAMIKGDIWIRDEGLIEKCIRLMREAYNSNDDFELNSRLTFISHILKAL